MQTSGSGLRAGGNAASAARRAQATRERILVVEDERSLRETLTYNLRRAGYDVQTADDGAVALAMARAQPPDLILLDVLLPGGMDGFEVCRLLRHTVRCPIVVVSALADEVDRVVGLEVGADDYVTKPFSTVELLARIKAHLRRAAMPAANTPPNTSSGQVDEPAQIDVGPIHIDCARREVTVSGKLVALKRREFDLLVYLARHAGMTLTRSTLLGAVWSDVFESGADTRTIDVHIRRLRELIEPDSARPQYLHTVRGVGYSLRAPSRPSRR